MTGVVFYGQSTELLVNLTYILLVWLLKHVGLCGRCCDYALLVLEQWSDSPEIQKLADIYEDLIKCCVADAISEVWGKRF